MNEVCVPFAHPVYVRSVLDYLNSCGVPPSRVLDSAGLTWRELGNEHRMVDYAAFRQIVAHASRCSGEPALGLLAGSMLQPYHTPVGIGTVTGSDVQEGLRFFCRYARLIFGSFDFRLDSDARWLTMEVRPLRPLCEIHLFAVHSILGMFCRLLEAMLKRPVDELVVGLPYARPASGRDGCDHFVRRIDYDRDCLSFSLPAELARLPCGSSDREAFLNATQSCQRLELESGRGALVQRVRDALLEQLSENPDLSRLAGDLKLSPRTLKRKLAEVGFSVSDIKDDLRKSNAIWYLQHTDLSIEAIALQLGYADTTNFSRRFRFWYQVAPSRMRQDLRL